MEKLRCKIIYWNENDSDDEDEKQYNYQRRDFKSKICDIEEKYLDLFQEDNLTLETISLNLFNVLENNIGDLYHNDNVFTVQILKENNDCLINIENYYSWRINRNFQSALKYEPCDYFMTHIKVGKNKEFYCKKEWLYYPRYISINVSQESPQESHHS
jgi:hypothetical protein